MSQKRFEIVNGQVVKVFEFEHGQWQQELPEVGETYQLSGDDVIKTEIEHGYQETEVYRKQPGTDIYLEIASSEQAVSSSPGTLNDHDSDSDTEQDDDAYHNEREDTEHDHSNEYTAGVISAESSAKQPPEVETPEQAHLEDQALARLYKAVFDRTPDTDGFRYWAEQLDSGLELDDVIENFLSSDEFVTTYSTLDNGQFLNTLYSNVLDRQADTEGFNYWHKQLESGAQDRAQIVQLFSDSDEFKVMTADEINQFISTVGQSSVTTDALVV